MKKNLKNERGITLVALVITIIVLLILAIVSVKILTDSSIIGHANNAVTAYGAAQSAEETSVTDAVSKMDDYASKIGKNESSSTWYTVSCKTAQELSALDWNAVIGTEKVFNALLQDTQGTNYLVQAEYVGKADTPYYQFMVNVLGDDDNGVTFATDSNTLSGTWPISQNIKVLNEQEILEILGDNLKEGDEINLLSFSQLSSLLNISAAQ